MQGKGKHRMELIATKAMAFERAKRRSKHIWLRMGIKEYCNQKVLTKILIMQRALKRQDMKRINVI